MQEAPETQVQSLDWEDPPKEEMATHSSILAWKILWTEEPGGLQSMDSDTTEQAYTRVASGPFNQLFRDATSEFLSYSDWLITSGVIVELQEDTNIQNRSSVPTHQAG